MATTPQTLGQRIAALRERRGWTQKQLAGRAEISVTFLSEVENDRRNMGSEILLRMANALGTSLDYLMRGGSTGIPPQPIVIPPELSAAAEDQDWSHAETVALLLAQQSFVGRRTKHGEGTSDRTLSTEDWLSLHRALSGNG